MSDRIFISNLKVFGHHGVTAEEKRAGQYFIIDVECDLDLSGAVESDDLGDTLDYAQLIETVTRVVEDEEFNLIEALAGRLVEVVLRDTRVEETTVRIAKSAVGAGVELRRHR
ncbi:MAG: dihydroneopterin aldolase [Actinomycetota bacterium]